MTTSPTHPSPGAVDLFPTPSAPPEQWNQPPAEGTPATSKALAAIPGLPGGSQAAKAAPKFGNPKGKKTGRKVALILAGIALLGGSVGGGIYLTKGNKVKTADLILSTVKPEMLDLSVVERGQLESSENKDVLCRVKAGSRGTYASTIKWVIDDGTLVKAGQTICILDSSSLEDSQRAQRIQLESAYSAKISAEQKYKIDTSQNESDIETAKINIQLSELDLEKYVGLPKGTLLRLGRDKARVLLGEMEGSLESFLLRYRTEFNGAKGEYQQSLDEFTGKVELSRADLEQWRDKVAASQRLQLKGFYTPAQLQADEARLASANETFKKDTTALRLLQTFTAQRTVKDLSSKVQEAWRAYERVYDQAIAKEELARAERKTKLSIFDQETEKLKEIDEQIHQCKITAPQDGMVVYFVPESSRGGGGGGTSQGLIAQGEQVREGQRLMRIPDLNKMQVSTKVHEAMISLVKGDERVSTGFTTAVRTAMLLKTDPMARLIAQHEFFIEDMQDEYRNQEYTLASKGLDATIRIDAFPERLLKGHVRTVATVASQQDWNSADVKTYNSVVSIDDAVPNLKPGMSAEVTIHIDNSRKPVPVIPVQAVVGGAEGGAKRKVFVMGPDGPVERDIVLGLNNDKKVEVKEGLQEGEQVVLNPKAIIGDKAKTREAGEEKGRGKGGEGKGMGKKGGAAGGGGAKSAAPKAEGK